MKVLSHHDDVQTSSGHLYIVRVNDITEEKRNEIIKRMAEKGVTCNVHYKPLPMMSAYKDKGFNIKDYPNAYHQYENEITLPLYSKMTWEDAAYVAVCFKECLKECGCC